MARPTKDHQSLNIKISTSLSERLTTYSQKNGHTKTYVVESAIEKFLNEQQGNTSDKR